MESQPNTITKKRLNTIPAFSHTVIIERYITRYPGYITRTALDAMRSIDFSNFPVKLRINSRKRIEIKAIAIE
jgi:hypothetical protein